MAGPGGDEQRRPLLLVTNDDGVDAPGLWDLVAAVDGLGDIAVIAPAREQSWAGRAHRSDPDPAAADDAIHTSGTVGAAWEAAGSEVPALAFSRPHVVDDVVRGKHISLTLLPRRHGLADASWVPAERT